MLYVKKINIYSAYISKHTVNHKKKVILLMIPNVGRWHYLAEKKLPALLRKITSKHVLFEFSSFVKNKQQT